MSYDGINNLNELSTAAPLNGASQAELAQAIRQIKAVVKNVLLQAHRPNGNLRPISAGSIETDSVGGQQLIDLSVSTAKLIDLCVTAAKLANLSVAAEKIADGALIARHFANASIPEAAFQLDSIPLTALAQAITSAYLLGSDTDNTLRAVESRHIKDLAVLDRCIASMSFAKLLGGADGQLLVGTGTGWEAVTPAGALTFNTTTRLFEANSTNSSASFGDVKSRGAQGGSSIANTWVTRDLGELEDGRGLMVFSGNSFRLLPGLYFITIRCPVAGNVGRHQARLFRDNGDATNVITLWGSSGINLAGQTGESLIQGTFEVTDPDWLYKVEHWCELAVTTTGFGSPATSDNSTSYGNHSEVYTQGTLIKLG